MMTEISVEEQKGEVTVDTSINNNHIGSNQSFNFDREHLLALITWLRTFRQFECINKSINTNTYNEIFNNNNDENNNSNNNKTSSSDTNSNKTEQEQDDLCYLDDVNFVNCILFVTEEIIKKRKRSDEDMLKISSSVSTLSTESSASTSSSTSRDSVDTIWGKIFHTITKRHTYILSNQIAGNHFQGKEPIRYILLSNLLCIAVNSPNNTTYVGKIMNLDNSVQSKLRYLIENNPNKRELEQQTPAGSVSSIPKRNTPTKTPSSRYYKTAGKKTPTRSGSSTWNDDIANGPSSLKKAAQQQQQSPNVPTSQQSNKSPYINRKERYMEKNLGGTKDQNSSAPADISSSNSRVLFSPKTPNTSTSGRNLINFTPSSITSTRSKKINTPFTTPKRTKQEEEDDNLFALIYWLHTFSQLHDKTDEEKEEGQLLSSLSSPYISKETTDFLSTIVKRNSSQRNILVNDEKFSSAILQIANEIFIENENEHNDIHTAITEPSTFSDSTDKDATTKSSWDKIKELITDNIEGDDVIEICGCNDHKNNDTELATERVVILSTLLCYAVSTNCSARNTYISRITTLSSDIQTCLMNIIQEHGSRYMNSSKKSSTTKSRVSSAKTPQSTTSYRTVGSVGKGHHYEITSSTPNSTKQSSSGSIARSFKDAFGTPSGLPGSNYTSSYTNTGHTPQRKKQASFATPSGITPNNVMSISHTTEMIERMARENKRLLKELEEGQKREKELNNKVNDIESKFRGDMIQIESKSMQKEEELRMQYEEELTSCKKEIDDLREYQTQTGNAKEEIASLKDEIDILHHTKDKLDVAEEKLRNYKERLEQYHTIKDALKKEEEAHSESVEQCIRLSNELNSYQPLKRQLEEYKTKALNAEVMLAECQDELHNLKEMSDKVTNDNYMLRQTTSSQQQEADELRKQISMNDRNGNDDGLNALGDGFSELNPAVKEEVLRLRNENKQLREFVDKRSDDSVQKLEEELDDKGRLSERFKEQFLSTKHRLEDTEVKLAESQKREEVLIDEVADWKRKAANDEKLLAECSEELELTNDALNDTRRDLDESQQREAKLQADLAIWTEKTKTAEDHISRVTEELNTTKANLDDACQALCESESRERNLKENVTTLAANNEKADILLSKTLEELHTVKAELNDRCQELNDAQDRIQTLTEDVEELTQKIDDAECIASQRMELVQSVRHKLQEAENQLHVSKDHNEELLQQVSEWTASTKEANKLCDQYQTELTALETNLSETKLELSGAMQREENLAANVQELKTRNTDLEAKLDELRLLKQQELDEASFKLRETEVRLRDDTTKEIEQVEKNMNLLLNDERQAYSKMMSQKAEELDKIQKKLIQERNEIEKALLVELKLSQEAAEKRYAQMEHVYKQKLEDTEKKAAVDMENMMKKGQEMMKGTKEKSDKKIHQLEDKQTELTDSLSRLRGDFSEYEKKSLSKISSYKHRLNFATNRINELTTENDDMQDNIKALEREKFKQQEENDRMRRQLGGRFGENGKVQSQLSLLQKEFNAVLDENRELKKKASSSVGSGIGGVLSPFDPSNTSDISHDQGEGSSSYSGGTVSRSTLAQYRQEYEETISELNDEKRELVMRNSAAITDVQKAEQRAWESEKENAKLKEELTSVKLALQRSERLAEIDQITTETPDDRDENDPNLSIWPGSQEQTNSKTSQEERYSDDPSENQHPISLEVSPKMNTAANRSASDSVAPVLSPRKILSSNNINNVGSTNRGFQVSGKNRQTMLLDVYGSDGSSNSSGTSPTTSEKKKVPTLMEYTTVRENRTDLEGKQECQQS